MHMLQIYVIFVSRLKSLQTPYLYKLGNLIGKDRYCLAYSL